MRRFRWITAEIAIFFLFQKTPLDAWVSPSVPTSPVVAPAMGTVGPLPMHFRPGE